MYSDEANKKKIVILAIIATIIIIVPLFIFSLKPKKYGVGIEIKGYDKYLTEIPRDTRDSLNSTLYNIVKMNLESNAKIDVKDAVIRGDKSITNKYDNKTKVTSGTFIVDMASIKQSYLMHFEWSSEKGADYSGYPVVAECLPIEKLVYGDFNCKDMFTVLKENRDPILDDLPYRGADNYSVTASYDENKKIMLDVAIRLDPSVVGEAEKAAYIQKAKDEFAYWLSWVGHDIKDYKVNYTVVRKNSN